MQHIVLTRCGVAGAGWAANGIHDVGCGSPHASALRLLRPIDICFSLCIHKYICVCVYVYLYICICICICIYSDR